MQQPIGSGFGRDSTALDVIKGIDLSGKNILVTGGYSGLGVEIVRALVHAGSHVVVPARDLGKAAKALEGIDNITLYPLDLTSFASIKQFAALITSNSITFDAVINDAGVMASPETRVGPNWELQFATNHLGHYALINLLWGSIKDGARIVSVSSSGHRLSDIRWDDVQFTKNYDKWQAYGQSKTANVLFANKLNRLGKARGIKAFSIHPGAILTPLQRHMSNEEQMERGWTDAEGNQIDPSFKSVEQGAATAVWAATSPQLDNHGGEYCEDCDIAEVVTSEGTHGVRAYAIDDSNADALWTLSANLTGIDAITA